MQDDDFLKQYQQDWQQDAETLDKGLNIPLSTLHRNIQSSQPQPRRRTPWLWGAAASIIIGIGAGITVLKPTAPSCEPSIPLATQSNEPLQVASSVSNRPYPKMPNTISQPNREAVSVNEEQIDLQYEAAVPTIQTECVFPQELPPTDYIETHRLVATAAQSPVVSTIETYSLVRVVVAPSRKPTFHSSVIEPLLALATNDLD